jgi:hypothetical protein
MKWKKYQRFVPLIFWEMTNMEQQVRYSPCYNKHMAELEPMLVVGVSSESRESIQH